MGAKELHKELSDRLAGGRIDHANAKNHALGKAGELKKGMDDKAALNYISTFVSHYRHKTGEGKSPGKDGKFDAATTEEAVGDFMGLMERYGMSPEEVMHEIKKGNLQVLEQYATSKQREKEATIKNGHYFTKVHPNAGDEKFIEDFAKLSDMDKAKIKRKFRDSWETYAEDVVESKVAAYKK